MKRSMLALFAFVTLFCSAEEPDWDTCKQQTTMTLSDKSQLVVTLDDAERIRAEVLRFLKAKKPKFEKPLSPPDRAFIDCWDTVRMGEWMLSPAWTDAELTLTAMIADNALVRVLQEIRLKRNGSRWKAVSTGQVVFHKRY